ncbi:MAG: PrpR N-terminal domain-containing protein, partial [Clostridium sp.]
MLEAEKAKAAGCQIVIARGLQAQMIKDHTDIPVVEMTISTQEIGLMIRKAKAVSMRMECPTIAIGAVRILVTTITLAIR